jgi:putative transposase
VKYRAIDAHREQFGIVPMCAALSVSRSGYYAWRARPESRRCREDRSLVEQIRAVHQRAREAYGTVKTWRALRDAGVACGRHRVARLRRQNRIQTRRVRRFRRAYAARLTQPPAPNYLAQRFQTPHADRVWMGDITFIPTRDGWLYVAVLLDLYSRRVVGWSMSDRINPQLVIDALQMAIQARRPTPGLIHHSDQGVQYSASIYQTMLRAHGMVCSMSRKGNCYDNAVVESFFSTLKNELTHDQDYKTRDEAKAAIFDYIEVFYNRQRSHQTLDYRSPIRYEQAAGVS